MIGPLPKTKRGNRHIITLVDYFSKWPEDEPAADKSATTIAMNDMKVSSPYGQYMSISRVHTSLLAYM